MAQDNAWWKNDAPVEQSSGTDWLKADKPVEEDAPARGFKGWAQDIGATALKGAIGVPEALVGLADIPTGGAVGKFLENEGGAIGFRPKQAKEIASDWNSDATKQAQKKFQAAEGIGGKLQAAIENPSIIATSIGESLPAMGAGGVAARGILGATRLGAMGAKGAAIAGAAGEGAMMAGQQAESIRQETEDGYLTPGQSALAAGTGLIGGVVGAASGRFANRLGIGDVDTMVAQGAKSLAAPAAQGTLKSIPKKVIQGAMTEGLLEELPQSVVEQVMQNLALGKDWSEGVDEAVVLGTLSGGAMGGGASGFKGYMDSRKAPEQAPAQPPVQPPAEQPQPMGASLTGTAPADLMARGTDPLAGQIADARVLADDAAITRNDFAERNNEALTGGGMFGSRADPLANMLADQRTSDANTSVNIQRAAEKRPPMPATAAANILVAAQEQGLDFTVAPHPDGGYLVIPRAWVTPQVAKQAEASLRETLARVAQVEDAPIQRAARVSTNPAALDLNTDTVAGYVDNLRTVNTPAAKAFVGEFDAGRITRQDVEQRMAVERGKTADERLAEAAAQARAPQDPYSLPAIRPSQAMGLNPAAGPMSSAAVIAVDGGAYQSVRNQAAQTQPSTPGEPTNGVTPDQTAQAFQATPQGQEVQPAPANLKPPRGILAKKAEADAARAARNPNGQAIQPATEAANDAGAVAPPAAGRAGVSGVDEQGAVPALSNVASLTDRIREKVRDAALDKAVRQEIDSQLAELADLGKQNRVTMDDLSRLQEITANNSDRYNASRDLHQLLKTIRTRAAGNIQTETPANVQNAPQAANDGQAQAAPVEASTPAGSNAAAAGELSAARDTTGMEADGVNSRALIPAGLTLEVSGKLYPVDSLEQASEMMFKARKQFEKSKAAGNAQGYIDDAPIRDGSGRIVGYVGRGESVFEAPNAGPTAKKLYDAGMAAAQRDSAPRLPAPATPGATDVQADGVKIAEAAHQAATSHKNDLPQPTDAQKEAGNYAKGHITINGLDITIENPAGSKRRPEWPALKNHYGYFKGSVGADKDHVDVFMTDRADDASLPVFVVDQTNRDGTFDEHKIIMGAADEAEARATYLQNYEKGWTGLGAITQMSQDEFKAWVRDPAKTKKPVALKRGVLAKMEAQRAAKKPLKIERSVIVDAYMAGDGVIRGKTFSPLADRRHKSRIKTAMTHSGVNAGDAEKIMDLAATIKVNGSSTSGGMTFLSAMHILDAAEQLGIIAPAEKPVQFLQAPEQSAADQQPGPSSARVGKQQIPANQEEEDHIKVKEGKGLIKGKYLVDVDGDGAPGGPWDTPEQARLAGEEWKSKTIQNAKDSKQERERWNAIAESFKSGKDVTTAQIESLGLKAGTSDVRWFFPISARLFDITSRDIRPMVKDLIRDSFTDMGAKREFVPTRKALEAIAADVVAGDAVAKAPPAEPVKPEPPAKKPASKSEFKVDRTFLPPPTEEELAAGARYIIGSNGAGERIEYPGAASDAGQADNAFMGSKRKPKAQGTPTDRAVMAMAAEGKSADEILRFIANASKSPFNRQMANLLRRTKANPAVSIGGDMGGGAGFKFLAKYSRKNHEVTLSEGAAGKAEQILLHEMVHAATLLALDRGGEHAARMKALYESVKAQGLSDAYGMKNVGEFVAEAFTNPEFQKALKGYKAPGGTAWDRFVAAVRRILGLSDQSQDALSAALELGVKVMRENMPLRKARSFSAEDAPEYFGMADAASLKNSALEQIHNTLSHPGKVSVWDKTIGTMRNLAERAPAFKPVFEAAQRFLDDVSLLANEAADVAPRLLPRVESWRDLTKKPVSAEDNKAISKPIFEGTLMWGRDTDGKPALVDDMAKKYASLSTEKRAKMLMAAGRLDDRVLRMWQGLPSDQFDALVNSRFESQMLKAGVVWTDAELKSLFNLNDQQISLYREARQAIDRSIDLTARADMLRAVGTGYAGMRDAVLELPTLADARDLLVETLHADALDNEDQSDRLMGMVNTIADRFEKATELSASGYAPLSRFGRYTLDVVDANGERQYFGLYETMRDANLAKIQMAGAFPGATITQGTMSAEAYKLFAGITPESLELFGNMLGLDAEGSDARDKAFQEYLKLSKNNHSALKRLMHRKGIAGYSEDVGRVLASFVYSNARQAAGGLNAGTIEEAVNAIPKDQGELKDVAIGLRDYVRDPQEEGQAIRGMLFAQYLGGSLASAFVNTTQPFAVTLPWLSQFGGMKVAGKHLAKALKDMAGKGAYESDLKTALDRAEEDGVVSPQEIHQLMAQARGAGGLRSGDGTRSGNARAAASNAWERTKVAWGQPFALAEQFNRRSTFIAAYRLAKERGMKNPAEFARRAVLETQFLYSKANKPKWARGAVGGTLFTFKTYSVSYLELLNRMWTQGGPEGKRAVGWAMVMLMLMGGAGGLPFLEDLEDLIDGIAQMMGYNVSSKLWRKQAIEDVIGKELGEFVNSGLSGLPGAPIDVSGRLGMGDLIPGTGLLMTKQSRERDLMEIVGPAGDLVARGFTGARKALSGDIGGAALELSPGAVRNAANGIDMVTSGQYKDAKGYKVLDTTLPEAATKLIGFQPRSVAKVQEANSFMMRSKSYYTQQSSEIKAQWARALYEKDDGALQDVRDRLAAWNRNNPDQPIVVKMPDVWKRVREMGKDRTERIADTAPKALRQEMRELARDN